jgi:hypothetical protein
MKTVFINLEEEGINYSKEVPINSIIKIDSSFVDMGNHLHEDDLGLLIHLEHYQTITILNLTDVTSYVLLFFDGDLIFKGASYSLKSGGSFTLQTQYKNILLVKLPLDFELNTIIKLEDEH